MKNQVLNNLQCTTNSQTKYVFIYSIFLSLLQYYVMIFTGCHLQSTMNDTVVFVLAFG